MKISKTSRVLSVYHLFLNCEEVSFQEFTFSFGVSQRTALRDIRLLKQAGVLETRWDRKRQAFVPVTLEPFPIEEQENKTRQKYLEQLRRLCILMRRMSWAMKPGICGNLMMSRDGGIMKFQTPTV